MIKSMKDVVRTVMYLDPDGELEIEAKRGIVTVRRGDVLCRLAVHADCSYYDLFRVIHRHPGQYFVVYDLGDIEKAVEWLMKG